MSPFCPPTLQVSTYLQSARLPRDNLAEERADLNEGDEMPDL